MAYVSFKRRGLAALLACLALSACSGTDPMPLAAIGPDKSHNELLGPVGEIAPQNVTYQAPQEPVQTASQGIDYINTPNLAGTPEQPVDAVAVQSQARQQTDTQVAAISQPAQDDEIDMDSQFGFTKGQSSGAPEIAEGNVSEPVVSGIGTGDLTSNGAGGQISDDMVVRAPRQGLAQQVAFIPRASTPMSVPEPSGGGMPASEVSCRLQLQRMGARFVDIAPIHDGPHCGINYPVELKAIGSIRIQPAAKLNCAMALTFARWTQTDVVPAARLRYLSSVRSIRQLSSYSCRRMNSKSSNPWSEHARGNAIDIGEITLNNGKRIDVHKPGFFSFREKGLLNTVRADSCKYFNTVLGPGDPHHGDHFHFDLRHRRSGKRYCSLD